MKVFLELGALLELERRGFLTQIKKFIGCSIGSLVSLLLVSGYNILQIINEFLNEDIFSYIIDKLDLDKIYKSTGLINPNKIKSKLSIKLLSKFTFVPNLQQLYLATGKGLYCVAYNITRDTVDVFSHETTPECSCIDAVLFSMNIPGLFYQMKYDNCLYVDGALGNPYPIDVFDDGKTKILGVSIDSESTLKIESGIEYFYKIIQSPMIQLKKRILSESSSLCKNIEIKSTYFDTLGVSLDNKKKEEMIIQGIKQVQEILEKGL
jgi:predicted acylesterase/phospholipase RssA